MNLYNVSPEHDQLATQSPPLAFCSVARLGQAMAWRPVRDATHRVCSRLIAASASATIRGQSRSAIVLSRSDWMASSRAAVE